MSTSSSYLTLDLNSHRRKMLRFIWVIIGGLILASYASQFLTGELQTFPIYVQLLFFGYLVICFVLSRIRQLFWLAPHMLLSGMLLLFFATCLMQGGINNPAAHFIPLIPALCSLLMGSQKTTIYAIVVGISIAILTIIDPSVGIRNASTQDLLNGATLILSTAVVTAGVVFIAKHNEQLISVFKGKSGYDELTGLPNRYLLRKHFDQTVLKAEGDSEALPGLTTIGIDGFIEYNRKHGEQAGDMILVQAAHAISSLVPQSENFLLGRTQGNSFTLIFSNTDDDELQKVATKIQKGVEALNIMDVSNNPFTASVAVLKFTLENEIPSGTEALIKGHKSLLTAQSRGAQQIASFKI